MRTPGRSRAARALLMSALRAGDEQARLRVLHATGLLDTEPDPAFDAMARSAALISGCRIALISLCDAERIWFKAAHGTGVRDVPRHGSLCAETVGRGSRFEVREPQFEPRFAADRFVADAPHARYYFGEPLLVDGSVIGSLSVFDSDARELSAECIDALHGLARIASELARSRRGETGRDRERQRLLDFVRASGDWVWETDAHGRYTWLSETYDAVTGEKSATKIGHEVADSRLLDAFGRPLVDGSGMHDLLRAGRAFQRILTEKNTPRGRLVISRSAVPAHDASGRLIGWRGTARNLTEPIGEALRLHAQDDLLKQLSSQAPGVIYQFLRHADGRGEFQFVNERSLDLFGLTPAELLADASCFYRVLHPDDRERVRQTISAHADLPGPLQIEYRVLRPDGAACWVSATSSPERRIDGSLIWRGFVADVTERKQMELALRESEARWEMAADATGIGIAQLDVHKGELRLDARACANHGIGFPHPRYAIDDWLAAIHADDRAGARAALFQAIEETGLFEARYRFQRADGQSTWLEVVARVERGAPQHGMSLIGTCRDITEQMAVAALREGKEAAERASQAKTAFLSRVSHELRTPLNGILGFAQLMALDRDHVLAEEQQRRLDGVQRSGEHLLALINDVLDIARIEHDDFSPRLQPVDLARVVDACLAMIEPLAAASDVRLPAGLPGPTWVFADARAIEQVLMNLLSNAIKYNRHGGSVRLELTGSAARVALSVEDDGTGLSDHQQAQLFQPFNRLGAERRRIAGSGLGLVIARQLMLAMQGDLRVASGPGRGCRFTLELGAAAPPDAEAPTIPSAFDDAAVPAGPVRSVLYIEDEPLNVVLMQEVFRHSTDWVLHTARDGAEGLAMAHELLPDLLLIDINLPDMTGTTVVRELRRRPRTAELHCIALSADAMREQIDTAIAAGFDDYWTKPINVAALMRTMASTLARGRTAS